MARTQRSTTKPLAGKKNEQSQVGLVIGVVVIVVVAFVGLIFVMSQTNAANQKTTKYADLAQGTTELGAPILGDPAAKITLLEFADFSCPHCLEYHPTIQGIIESFVRTGQARLAFYPQTFVGDRAGNYSQVATQAALCAGKQGMFWEMHDALYGIAETVTPRGFEITRIKETAKTLGLDTDKLVQCMLNGETKDVIGKSAAYFQQMGAQGTPAIMYSTDGGKTFEWFKAPNGDIMGIPPLPLIASAIADLNAQK
jgi:protein-disulfide isomerase